MMVETDSTPKKLSWAILQLENLTRECFDIARKYWDKKEKDIKDYDIAERIISEKIAKCLSKILFAYGRGINKGDIGRVFFAPRYRGVGKLKQIPSARTIEKINSYKDFTWNFGSIAEKGNSINTKNDSKHWFFMPVAFWNNCIYENGIAFQNEGSASTKRVTISGFSGWSAKNGLLGYVNRGVVDPIYGLHFSFHMNEKENIQTAEYDNGILNVGFPKKTNCFEMTEIYLKALDTKKYVFSNGRFASKQMFPLIDPKVGRNEKILLEALFSTLFYSNFYPLPYDNDNKWKEILSLREIPKPRSVGSDRTLREVVAKYYELYRKYAKDAHGKVLTFNHYYVFLLNPSFNYQKLIKLQNKVENKEIIRSAIGTVNVYSDYPIETILLSVIRKHVESIYHTLRGMEDWEDATESALDIVNNAMGHEVVKVYSTARDLLDYGIKSKIINDKFIIDVAKASLSYGILWGKSAYYTISEDGILWDEYGNLKDLNNYFKYIAKESWKIFLAADVFRDQDASEITVKYLKYPRELWDSAERVCQKIRVDVNDEYEFRCPILFDGSDEREYRKNISLSIYRWMIAVFSNAWKHLVLKEYENINSLNEIDKRKLLINIKKIIRKWNDRTIKININMNPINSQESLSFNVCNEGKPPKKIDSRLKSGKRAGTFLVMIVATEEMLSLLNVRGALDAASYRTSLSHIGHNWQARLCIPGMNIVRRSEQ